MRLAMIDIAKASAAHFEVTLEDIFSDCREPEFAWPRQFAMYMCREHTGRSLPDIGSFFNRDHTTVLHAMRAVRASRYSVDGCLAAKAEILSLAQSYAKIRLGLQNEWVQKLKDGVPFAPPPGWGDKPRETAPPRKPRTYDPRIFVPADSVPKAPKRTRGAEISWTPSPERLRAGRA